MSRLLGAAAFSVFATVLWASPCAAQISEVTISIDGATCPQCGPGVEKNLRAVEGIAAARVAPAERVAHVRLKPRTAFEPEKLRAAVEKSGEKVRSFGIQMCANVEVKNGHYYLHAPGATQRFALHSQASGRGLGPLTEDTLVCLKGKIVSTSPLEIDLTEFTHP